MATNNTKFINTRIKNKVDFYETWEKSSGKLLNGEIAIARIDTGKKLNPVTGVEEPSWELLMKVGDGNHAFNELPWLSAKASDVYNWAKGATAEGVKINIANASTALEGETDNNKTLARWVSILRTDINSNDADIADINKTLDELTGGTSGSSIAQQIQAAIDALEEDLTTDAPDADEYKIVKALRLDNGKVKVEYGTITNEELPNNISANKIVYTPVNGSKTNLDEHLKELDSKVANKLGEISVDPATATTNGVVQGITYDSNGKFTVTYDTVKTDDIADSAVTTAKITDRNVTGAKIATEAIKDEHVANDAAISSDKISIKTNVDASAVNLTSKISTIEGRIASIDTAITGGVHFIGITDTKLEDGSTTLPTITGKDYNEALRAAGDIVLYKDGTKDEKEFIWTGSAWEELGDLTRIGAVETAIDEMDVTETNEVATTHKFVSQVTQDNGKINVVYTQPDSADVAHIKTNNADTTVKDELQLHESQISTINSQLAGIDENSTVVGYVSSQLDALDYDSTKTDYPDTTDSDTNGSAGYKVIGTVSQNSGQISATAKTIPTATDSVYGIVKLSDAVNSDLAADDGKTAATPKAVKTVQDALDIAEAAITKVEGDYIRFADANITNASGNSEKVTKLYAGKDSTQVIIFDCGGAYDLDI